MPICIECCYPVPQLYHVLHSTKQHKSTPARNYSPLSANLVAHAGATTPLVSTHSSPFPPAAAAVTSPSSFSTLTAQGSSDVGEAKFAAKAKTSQAGGRGGGDVRLTQCPRCKRFADKYVEHDFVVLFIDLVLVKPQVGLSCYFCLF